MYLRPSQGFGEEEKRAFILREQRPNFEGNKNNIGDNGTYENKFSLGGAQGKKGTGDPWDCLLFAITKTS